MDSRWAPRASSLSASPRAHRKTLGRAQSAALRILHSTTQWSGMSIPSAWVGGREETLACNGRCSERSCTAMVDEPLNPRFCKAHRMSLFETVCRPSLSVRCRASLTTRLRNSDVHVYEAEGGTEYERRLDSSKGACRLHLHHIDRVTWDFFLVLRCMDTAFSQRATSRD